MHTVPIEIPRNEVRALYRKYKEQLHYSQPVDRECMRAYQLLAQGRLIIKALESIRAAGASLEDARKLAGHNQQSTTSRYSRGTPEAIERALETVKEDA